MLPFNMGVGAGASGVDTGDIGHSLRFRTTASQVLTRTDGVASDNKKTTTSFWVKRTQPGTWQGIFCGGTTGSPITEMYFYTDDNLYYQSYNGASNVGFLQTSRVFRDPTAWIHILLVQDFNNATAANRQRIWINGVEETSFASRTNHGTGDTSYWNNASYSQQIGRSYQVGTGTAKYLDGYLARFCRVDNYAATDASSFGYLNTQINEWVSKSQSAVKAVVDAGGTNSFMLDFDDATSLTTLGYDKSSKGNNWTLNNFSLTAGTTYDHMLDVPGNSFATLNPVNKTPSHVLSEANLKWEMSGGAGYSSRSTMSVASGKWYAEIYVTAKTSQSVVGVLSDTYPLTTSPIAGSGSVQYYANAGTKYVNGSSSAYGAAWTTGDLMGIALNMDALTVEFFKNGTSQGSIALGTTGLSYYMSAGDENYLASVFQWNFGQAPLHASATYDSAAGGYFRYTPPTGFKALCQANLQDVAIKNPKLHFDINTRTGTAATYSVTGLGFQPDLLWSKSRGRAVDHALYDSVRGVQKQLESNSTGAETTETTGLTAFNSDGYTGGALDQINGTTATNSFVDWLWKAGGAAVSNTAGSITSQVSANVDAGFSIVTYTGTGANATVGHGLTKVPKLVIAKQRTAGTVENWAVSHTSIANTEYLLLNTTAAKTAGATYWNSTTPTTSVFSVGSAADTNESAKDFVAYCFADIEGYSKAFSYVGNGSADGPYVHLGFKPRWVLIKCSSAAGNPWLIFDSVRDPDNLMEMKLAPNSSVAENDAAISTLSENNMDGLSSGFKLRTANAVTNQSAQTFIGFAIADVAGKYSLAR